MSLPTSLSKQGGYWRSSWYDDGAKRRWASFGNARKVNKSDALREYESWLHRWHADVSVRNPDRVGLTVGVLVDRYQEHADGYYHRPDRTPTREAVNISHAIGAVKRAFGELQAAEFSPAKLRQVQESMVQDRLARNTINKRIAKVRAMFKWAVRKEFIQPSVWHGLQAVEALKLGRTAAVETENVHSALMTDVEKVRSLVSKPVRAMIDLQLLTGMRPTEVCIMRGVDLDMTGREWLYRPQFHKTQHHGKDRCIVFGPKAQAIITPYLVRDLQRHLFRSTHHQATLPHYNRDSYYQAVMRACRRAKVPRWSPGQLRHNAATMLRAEYGLEAAKVILGHSKIETTQVYAEASLERARQIMSEVG